MRSTCNKPIIEFSMSEHVICLKGWALFWSIVPDGMLLSMASMIYRMSRASLAAMSALQLNIYDDWGFYEFSVFWDGPYFFKENAP